MLADAIIDARLAACVQVLPPMRSVYRWQGEVKSDTECLLMIKSAAELYPKLELFIKDHHSYDVPEIVAIEAANISAEYSHWLNTVLS